MKLNPLEENSPRKVADHLLRLGGRLSHEGRKDDATTVIIGARMILDLSDQKERKE